MEQAKPGIFDAIINVMRDINPISKDQKNTAQGFSFRGIDQIYNELNPHMVQNGIFTLPRVEKIEREERVNQKGSIVTHVWVTMNYRFYFAGDGSFVDCLVAGEAVDTGDKATTKAMSIAHKYAFLQIFSIPTKEEKDPDFQTHELAKEINNRPRKADVIPYTIPMGKYKGKVLSEERSIPEENRMSGDDAQDCLDCMNRWVDEQIVADKNFKTPSVIAQMGKELERYLGLGG